MHAIFTFKRYEVQVLRKTKVNILVKLVDNSWLARKLKKRPMTYIGRVNEWRHHPSLRVVSRREAELLEKMYIRWRFIALQKEI